jgi:hypothetical protein
MIAGSVCGAAGLAAVTLALAGPAPAMPTPVGSAQDVVRALEAAGFQVILNTVGTPSLDRCAVTAVRPGPAVAESATTSRETPSRTAVYVDVTC